jgi:hypothetical protein
MVPYIAARALVDKFTELCGVGGRASTANRRGGSIVVELSSSQEWSSGLLDGFDAPLNVMLGYGNTKVAP